MTIKLKIVTLGTKPLFLGITWLCQYNPDIDWENATPRWRNEDTTLQLSEYTISNSINQIYDVMNIDDQSILSQDNSILSSDTSGHGLEQSGSLQMTMEGGWDIVEWKDTVEG